MRKKPHPPHPSKQAPEAPADAPLPAVEPAPDAGAAPGLQAPADAPEAVAAAAPPPAPEPVAAPAAPAEDATSRLSSELAEQKDRLLRMAADFDNYRKRSAKERADPWGRAQADLVQRLLDVVDDLGRVAHLDPAQTSALALHEGMGLVEKKLLKAFESAGVERIDPSGAAFDPNAHEAVMTVPAPSADLDGQVSTVFQAGYRSGALLLRPARVAVYAWVEPAVPDLVN